MYINCSDIFKVGENEVETVKDFKYLGLIMSNSSKRPEALL